MKRKIWNLKIIILSTFSFFILHIVSGQNINEEHKLLLDGLLKSSETYSLYSSQVDWDQLKTEVYSKAEGAESIENLQVAFNHLFNSLRDHHGRVLSAADYSNLGYFTDTENKRFTDPREYDSETWALMNDLDARFESQLLDGNVAYLKIVGVGRNLDGQLETERIRSSIFELSQQNVEHWIIDLRYNTGGNVNVMMSGIAPFFDTEDVVNIVNLEGDVQSKGAVKKGNFNYFEVQAFEMENSPKIKNPKIAVLTSRWTASSGEFVAVAFKGQKNTKFFGEFTGGYTTNNCYEVINDQIILVASTGIFADRNLNIYEYYVDVDVEINFEIVDLPAKDPGIIAAKNWLLGK